MILVLEFGTTFIVDSILMQKKLNGRIGNL